LLAEGHFGVIFEDVSEREQLQRQIAKQLRELERSNRELDDFAYVASHDLKAPLQDVRNLADWIAEDAGAALPESSMRHVALLGDRVRRMERLLDDLLEYSRIGRTEGAREDVSVRDVLAEVVALVRPPEGFHVEMRGESPVVSTPRAALEKVMRNLVGNAIKHHDRTTGSVVVTAECVGERVVIRVTDDGPGIPREFHKRVFAMFQTLRPRDELEGSGMGLTFVKKAVEHYGGKVGVESDGRGTTVVFDWPLATREPGAGGTA
jgi:signal transduction histidine kinase